MVFSGPTFVCVLGPAESGRGQRKSPGKADTTGKERVKDGTF